MEIIDSIKLKQKNIPDIQIKDISFGLKKLYIINIQTISSSVQTNDFILDYISKRSLLKSEIISSLKKDIYNYIPSISFIEIKKNEIMYYLLNGFSIIIYNDEIIACETKAQLERSISQPSSEPTIKGPKDAFNENYNTNIGLIRKRIKDENLHIKEFVLGKKSNTKVGILYLNDIVDKKLLKEIINKIKKIRTDKVLDTYYIKSLMKNENKSAFPTIKSTEKPDSIAKALTEGRICIVSENSCNVLIIPTFFIDFFHSDEDIYQKNIFIFFIRIIRLLAFFITIFAPALYLAIINYDQQLLPTSLLINFATQRASVPFPAFIEALILMITFEILYEGDALTPTARGTSLSILGALVLGDAAVSAGVVSPIMVIVVAITAISSIFFVYYDFQSFIRVYRYSLMLIASAFGIIGVLFGFIFLITNLCNLNSFGKPFMLGITPKLNIKSKEKLASKGLLPLNSNKGKL